jgi:hypothetical protein
MNNPEQIREINPELTQEALSDPVYEPISPELSVEEKLNENARQSTVLNLNALFNEWGLEQKNKALAALEKPESRRDELKSVINNVQSLTSDTASFYSDDHARVPADFAIIPSSTDDEHEEQNDEV